MTLRPIDPDNPVTEPSRTHLVVRRLTDAAQLRALLHREPVNPVDDLDDPDAVEQALGVRTGSDRRVFGLVHPEHPERVRTVVWVALTHGVPDSLVPLTDGAPSSAAGPDVDSADTAVFWSIWNDDRTVEGVGRGGDLIEGAAELLRAEHPGLSTMVTLSPAPGLRDWANAAERVEVAPDPLDRAAVATAAARYLTALDERGRPIDPVARFHLGNGARLWRVVPDADPSPRGRSRSFGLLVNYRYEPEDRAANRAELDARRIALGDQVRELLG